MVDNLLSIITNKINTEIQTEPLFQWFIEASNKAEAPESDEASTTTYGPTEKFTEFEQGQFKAALPAAARIMGPPTAETSLAPDSQSKSSENYVPINYPTGNYYAPWQPGETPPDTAERSASVITQAEGAGEGSNLTQAEIEDQAKALEDQDVETTATEESDPEALTPEEQAFLDKLPEFFAAYGSQADQFDVEKIRATAAETSLEGSEGLDLLIDFKRGDLGGWEYMQASYILFRSFERGDISASQYTAWADQSSGLDRAAMIGLAKVAEQEQGLSDENFDSYAFFLDAIHNEGDGTFISY